VNGVGPLVNAPVRPRLGARAAYLLQRIMMPNRANRWLSARIEASPRIRALFTAAEEKTKRPIFGCRMCGQCALPVTGYACPMTCPKELRNGPCGGVGADGSCEVFPQMRCVWVEAYERAESQGRVSDLCRLQRPVDHGRWGQSSWLNYWQGRDDDLWTGDDGLGAQPRLTTAPALRPVPAGKPARERVSR
jgi:hypothetical protein